MLKKALTDKAAVNATKLQIARENNEAKIVVASMKEQAGADKFMVDKAHELLSIPLQDPPVDQQQSAMALQPPPQATNPLTQDNQQPQQGQPPQQ